MLHFYYSQKQFGCWNDFKVVLTGKTVPYKYVIGYCHQDTLVIENRIFWGIYTLSIVYYETTSYLKGYC